MREFSVNVTEERQRELLEYLNDMQYGVDINRNRTDGSDYGFLSAMHYRDGFLRALAILGIDYSIKEYELTKKKVGIEFTELKKDIYKN